MMMALLLACPGCVGDGKSAQVHGAQMGVIAMLLVIVPILIGIAFIARSWARRARALERSEGAGPAQPTWFALAPQPKR